MVELEFGFNTGLGWPLTIEKGLARMAGLGVRYVEYDNVFVSQSEKSGEVEKTVKSTVSAAKSLGIRAVQIHGPFGEPDVEFSSPDPGDVEKGVERLRRWVGYTERLEAQTLILHPAMSLVRPGERFIEYVKRIRELNIRVFAELSEAAEQSGVRIALENRLEASYGSRIPDLLDLVESLGSRRIGVCLDTGHANVNNIPAGEAVTLLGRHLFATHVHDNDRSGDQHLPPLMGSVDWPRFIKAIEAVGYDRPIILEIQGHSDEAVVENRIRLASTVWHSLHKAP